MKRIDVVYALILKASEDAVLMVHNMDNNLWTLPGGAVEPGESLVQALMREVHEETGTSIEVDTLVSVNECQLTQYGEHALFFTFRARLLSGEPHVVRPKEIRSVQWMHVDDANKHLIYHPGGVKSLLEANCPYINEGVK